MSDVKCGNDSVGRLDCCGCDVMFVGKHMKAAILARTNPKWLENVIGLVCNVECM